MRVLGVIVVVCWCAGLLFALTIAIVGLGKVSRRGTKATGGLLDLTATAIGYGVAALFLCYQLARESGQERFSGAS